MIQRLFAACPRSASIQPSYPVPQSITFGSKEKNLPCTYYLAMPPQCLPLKEMLHVKRAFPLLKLLLQNERDQDMKVLLENCCNLTGDYVGLPLVASPITAMTLGFFAYKPLQSVDGQESDCLHLLRFSSKDLLDTLPPHSSPLCPFWLINTVGLNRMIENQEVALVINTFKMRVSLTAKYQTQMDLVEHHEKVRLQGRKRKLEDEVSRLEEELSERKAEIEQVAKKLCPLPEPLPEQVTEPESTLT